MHFLKQKPFTFREGLFILSSLTIPFVIATLGYSLRLISFDAYRKNSAYFIIKSQAIYLIRYKCTPSLYSLEVLLHQQESVGPKKKNKLWCFATKN